MTLTMERIAPMRTDLFDFELPATSIALRPASRGDNQGTDQWPM